RGTILKDLLLHWDGTAWSDWGGEHASDLPEDLDIRGMWASSPEDVWLVGKGWSAGLVMRWDGASWSYLSGDRGGPAVHARAYDLGCAIHGTSPNDVWTVGRQAPAGAAHAKPWALH